MKIFKFQDGGRMPF